jgi:polysaccharide export outer membrane protein
MTWLVPVLLLSSGAHAQEVTDANTVWGGNQPGAQSVALAEYNVGPGDVLSVIVLDEPSLTDESLQISPDGSINMPVLGRVHIQGRTPQQVEALLTRILARDYLVNPQVQVRVVEFGYQKVEVLGLVNKPGVYYLEGPSTVLQILADAGGTQDETISEIRVTRGAQELVFAYTDLTSPGGDQPVLAGDQVYIPEGKAIYVMGKVSEPGAVAWKDGMTLTQALTQAGGLSETARINKVYILRDGQRIEVNLKRILKGKESDYVLQPDDQVYIDESHV